MKTMTEAVCLIFFALGLLPTGNLIDIESSEVTIAASKITGLAVPITTQKSV